jgi:hypothetical protein
MSDAGKRLIDSVKAAREELARMTPAEREAMYRAQQDSFVRAEMAFGSDADEAEYGDALASGDPERIEAAKRRERERIAAYEAFLAPQGGQHVE